MQVSLLVDDCRRGADRFERAAAFPCIDCARAIVQSGIVRLVSPEPALDDAIWGASFPRSRAILEEGGVELVLLPA